MAVLYVAQISFSCYYITFIPSVITFHVIYQIVLSHLKDSILSLIWQPVKWQ